MRFLRFDSEADARDAFAPWIQHGRWPDYIGTTAVDVVGSILQVTDADAIEALQGWHINISSGVAELEQYEIDRPGVPARVFAGSQQPQVARVPESVLRWQAVRALRLHADPHAPERSCLATVHALRDAAPELQRADIDDALQAVLTWRRQSPTLQQIAQAADWSTDFVDELFIAAGGYDL